MTHINYALDKTFALFSDCREYRYLLGRCWDGTLPSVLFICLNPSTADETTDDPTVRRCVGFAKTWGFGSVVIANLFALRSTDPFGLRSHPNPIGSENDEVLTRIGEACASIVFAWGCHGGLLGRDQAMSQMYPEAYCLGKTKDGHPRHPLYLPANTQPKKFLRKTSTSERGICECLTPPASLQNALAVLCKRTPCFVSR